MKKKQFFYTFAAGIFAAAILAGGLVSSPTLAQTKNLRLKPRTLQTTPKTTMPASFRPFWKTKASMFSKVPSMNWTH